MISPSNREKEEKILSKPSKKEKGRWTKNDTELTVMALPTTIWYILFCFLPMFGLIIAFKNYKITGGKSFIYNLLHSDWVRLQKLFVPDQIQRPVRHPEKHNPV